MNLASIPSPATGVWQLGPIPLRAYAFCIVVGIVAACVITDRRLRARGAPSGLVLDLAVWAVPLGIIGARVYHVISDPELYFAAGRDWVGIFKIWNGGLGIWGAVAGGAVGAWIACRRRGIPLSTVADALAPGLPVAQALGRWGNYFNQELFGRPTQLPWGLQIAPGHRPIGYEQFATFQPTFLYECLWDLGVALVVWLADRRFRFGRGRAFALYVLLYVVGRSWVEALRIDHANHFGGLRLNDWVSIAVFLATLGYLLLVRGPRLNLITDEQGRVTSVVPEGSEHSDRSADDAAEAGTDEPNDRDDAGGGGSSAEPPPPSGTDPPDRASAESDSSDTVDTAPDSGGTEPDADGTGPDVEQVRTRRAD